MRRVVSLLALAGSTLVSAQNTQTTTGPNSHIINQGDNSKVESRIYLQRELTEREMQARLQRASAKSLLEVSKRLKNGEVEAARSLLEQFLASQSPQAKDFALAMYSRAQLHAASEDVGKAAQVMSAVVNLEVKNCYYKAAYGTLLMYMHRMQDVRSLLDEDQDRPRESCLLTAPAGERAMLLLMKVWLSAEARDQETALPAMEAAYRTLSGVTKSHSPEELVQPYCLFFQIASTYWMNTHLQRWPKSEEACNAVVLSAKAGPRASGIELLRAYYSSPSDRNAKVGAEIDARFTNFDEIPLPLSDRVGRQALFGAFKSDYGMTLLHSENRAERAAQVYAKAFHTLEPLLESGRPSVVVNFAQLVIRISHLEEISNVAVFPDTDRTVRAAMVKAGRARVHNNGRSTCEAFGRLAVAANRMQYFAAAQTLSAKTQQCRESAVPARSFSGLLLAYQDGEEGLSANDLQLLSRRIEARQQLFGFPEVKDIEAAQSKDLWRRGEIHLKNQRSSDGTGPDAMNDFRLAAELGSKHLESSAARVAVMGSLAYLALDDSSREWARRLLSEPFHEKESLPPFRRCIKQFFDLSAGEAVAAFSLRNHDNTLLELAVEHQVAASSSGNLCKNLPADRDLGAGLHSEHVDRMISQAKVMSAALSGARTSGDRAATK